MLSSKPLEYGDLRVTVYDFADAGDVLPKHNHDADTAHITIVAKGSFRVYSHDWEVVLSQGQIADFPAGQPHEFEALVEGGRIVNVIKKCRA